MHFAVSEAEPSCAHEQAMPDGPQIKDYNGKRELQLLHEINGCFSPGILSCLMGVSGAQTPSLQLFA